MNRTTLTPRWHPRLVEAAAALHANRLEIAEPLLKAHLKEDPFDAKAIRMLAEDLRWRSRPVVERLVASVLPLYGDSEGLPAVAFAPSDDHRVPAELLDDVHALLGA